MNKCFLLSAAFFMSSAAFNQLLFRRLYVHFAHFTRIFWNMQKIPYNADGRNLP